jgi:tRNA-dihydrouridine synthase B
MKQFASWFTHGVAGGAVLRKSIYEAKSGAAILAAVDSFFSREAPSLPAPILDHAARAVDLLPAFIES